MILDTVTLLVINVIFVGVITFIWLLSAFLFKSWPSISINFALGDFFVGCFVFFYVFRAMNPNNIFIYLASDIGVTFGGLFIFRATKEFISTKRNDLSMAVLAPIVMIIDIYARYNHYNKLAVSIICAIGCYALSRAWFTSYSYMIKNFRKFYCIITTGPLFFISLLLGLRTLLVFVAPDVATTELTVENNFNTAFLLVMLMAIIGFNLTALGLVISNIIMQIKVLSQEDPLTRAFNRRHINEIAEEEINKIKNNNTPLSVILLDIDYFKKVNDMYGHAAGDAALIACVDVIRKTVRSTDYVARLGGEEFCVLLPDTNSEEAKALAERLRQEIELIHIVWKEHTISITASFGISVVDSLKKNEWSNLLNKADMAMYQAKNNGRNQVVLN